MVCRRQQLLLQLLLLLLPPKLLRLRLKMTCTQRQLYGIA